MPSTKQTRRAPTLRKDLPRRDAVHVPAELRSVGHTTTGALLGRTGEVSALEHLLANVRGGQSAVLVVRGEAGVGKTALLHHCARQALGLRVLRVAGTESEAELPFAGVQQLCTPFLDKADALPAPQREALAVALGLAPGGSPDRFLVALAALGLLCAGAEDRPALCLIDDAQWVDDASLQVLGFVGRRLLADSVALIFAVREPAGTPQLDGLPDLTLRGLGLADARALLARAIPGPLDDRVRDRLVAETKGNPLALLELPGATPTQLAGGYHVAAPVARPGLTERRYIERIRALPDETQRLLLLAAADPTGDAPLLWRAALRVAIAPSALAPAEDAGLVRGGTSVRFSDPLVRSAAYGAASAEARRGVHEALAAACDPEADPDWRAWHRAVATVAPDEAVAAQLEGSSRRAEARGGLAAAATFLERATELTPDAGRRAERALAAADLKALSGAGEVALELLDQVGAAGPNRLRAARAQLVRGRAVFAASNGRDAPLLLLAAARELEPLDPPLAQDTLLDALSASLRVGRLAGDVGLGDVARAARSAPSLGRPQDFLLEGVSSVITDGYSVGAPALRRAVDAFRRETLPMGAQIRWLWLAAHAAQDLWDDGAGVELCDRHIALTRRAGALAMLPLALDARIRLHLFAGELATAASLVTEAATVTRATGAGLPPYGALALAAYQGHENEALDLIDAVGAETGPRGDGMGLSLVAHAEAVLFNGLGRYGEACTAAERGAAFPDELGYALWSLPQLVEAAARSDQIGVAKEAFERLTEATRASGTRWARGVEARSRALLCDDAEAERWYQQAIALLAETRVPGEHARALLLYGEWLRRKGRRIDARAQLRKAHAMLAGMGMEAYAERARRELVGTGERVRTRGAETRDDLTPQELQIAQLARDGLSNPEIGAKLFLSPRTVEWHMKKVFRKLGIKSRMALHDALLDRDRPMTAA